jgi:hypothetical protein
MLTPGYQWRGQPGFGGVEPVPDENRIGLIQKLAESKV